MKRVLTLLLLILIPWAIRAQEPELVIDPGSHTNLVTGVFFSKDGKELISVSWDKTIRVWDVEKGNLISTIRGHVGDGNDGRLGNADYDPETEMLVVSGNFINAEGILCGDVRVIDMRSRKIVSLISRDWPHAWTAQLSADREFVAVGYLGLDVMIYKVPEDFRAADAAFTHVATLKSNDWRKYLLQIDFTPDNKFLVATGPDSTFRFYELPNKLGSSNKVAQIDTIPTRTIKLNDNPYDFDITKDGQHYLFAMESANMILYDQSFSKPRLLDNIVNVAYIATFSPDGKLALSHGGLGAKGSVYGIPGGQMYSMYMGHDNTVSAATFSPLPINDKGHYMIATAGGNSSEIHLWNSHTGEVIKKIGGNGRRVAGLAFDDGLNLAISQYNIAPDGLKTWGKLNPNYGLIPEFSPLRATFNLNTLQYDAKPPNPADFHYSPDTLPDIEVRKLNNYKVKIGDDTIAYHPDYADGRIDAYAFTPDGNIVIGADHSLTVRDLKGNLVYNLKGHSKEVWGIAISKDGEYIATGSSDMLINIYSAKPRAVKDRYPFPGWMGLFEKYDLMEEASDPSQEGWEKTIEGLKAAGDSLDAENIETYYNSFYYERWPIATLFVALDNEWVCWTTNGYFASSKNGSKYIGWHVNNQPNENARYYTADQLWDHYYRPDIVQTVIDKKKQDWKMQDELGIGSTDISDQLNNVPKVVIASIEEDEGQATITLEATAVGTALDEVSLYHNGKLVYDAAGEDKAGYDKKVSKTYQVALQPGANEFEAVALNTEKTEARTDKQVVNYRKKLDLFKEPDLYIIAVGINQYENSNYNLGYCTLDADSVVEHFKSGASSIYGNIKQVIYLDQSATKENIKTAFHKVSQEAQPEDVLLFFFSGHGVMAELEENDPEFFLSTTEIAKLYGDPIHLKEKAISATELRSMLAEIKALKQVVMMDACQSGGAVESFAMKGAAEDKAKIQLARSTGTTILASSGTDQYSREYKELGHGLFTYVLLKGLSGEADGSNQDAKITVKELEAYINDQIPELTNAMRGARQYPVSYSIGQDFPLVIKQK